MEFTQIYTTTTQPILSQSTNLLAYSNNKILYICTIDNIEPIKTITCISNNIIQIIYSYNTQYIAILYSNNIVCIYNIYDNNTYECKITQPDSLTIERIEFTPNSNAIVLYSQYNLRCNIYSIVNEKSLYYINNYKFITFNKQGHYMIVCQRNINDNKDILYIYDTNDYTLFNTIILNTTNCNNIIYSHTNITIFAVIDHILNNTFYIYNVYGQILLQHTFNDINTLYVLPTSVTYTYNTYYCILSTYNQLLYIFNTLTYNYITTLSYNIDNIQNIKYNIVIYNEVIEYTSNNNISTDDNNKNQNIKTNNTTNNTTTTTSYILCDKLLPTNKLIINNYNIANDNDSNKENNNNSTSNSKQQQQLQQDILPICTIQYSYDDYYIAMYSTYMPNTVLIYDMLTFKLYSIINHIHSIKTIQWSSSDYKLYILCQRSNKLYIWSLYGCSIVELQTITFMPKSILCCNDNKNIVLSDNKNKQFVVCSFVDNQQQEREQEQEQYIEQQQQEEDDIQDIDNNNDIDQQQQYDYIQQATTTTVDV